MSSEIGFDPEGWEASRGVPKTHCGRSDHADRLTVLYECMRTLVTVCFVIAAACGGKTDEAKHGGVTRITYDVDLDKAVDDRSAEIKRDLEAGSPGTVVTVATTGIVTAAPSDPSKRDELSSTIGSSYAEQTEPRECAPDAAPGATCFTISAPYAATVKKAALLMAAKIVERRLAELHVTGATATPIGNQLVIELRGSSAEVLAGMRKVIPRSGVLELKIVDEGSDFMKRAFQKVGADGMDGKATDPEAAAAGISAGFDQWRAELTGEMHSDFYLRGPQRESLQRYFARLASLDPSFALPADRVLGFELVDPESPGGIPLWRSYLLERTPVLTGAAVANAEAVTDPNAGRPIVLLDFSREGARVFGEVTSRISGKKLAIVLDGTVKSAPIINSPIRGGRASITMGGIDLGAQLQDAKDLALVLRAGALPMPLVEVAVDVVP